MPAIAPMMANEPKMTPVNSSVALIAPNPLVGKGQGNEPGDAGYDMT